MALYGIAATAPVGVAGTWQFLSLNWPRLMRTSRPPKPSASGTTGWRMATASEADELGPGHAGGLAWVESRTRMAKRQSKSQPTWTGVKARLAEFDRAALLGLIQSLYTAHKDNQTFLHARFGLGEDVLEPYKKTIDRWLWPDLFRKQDTSVSQAKRAISDYKKAVGDPEGLAELMVFYCERAVASCSDPCNDNHQRPHNHTPP